jgi:phosphoglycolate phosphatase
MLLLFDLDGTLTDSRIGIVRCFAHALQQMGCASANLPLLVCVGPPLPVAFQTLLGTDEPALIEQAITAYRERFERIGMFENSLFPGVIEGLTAMRREGHRMRVVTAKPQPYALTILQHFQIDTFFEAVHGPTLADRAHDKIALVAAAVRDGESSDAVMIGDRGEDIRAAKINGIQSIAVTWGYGPEAELVEAGPTHSVRTMNDIVRWVQYELHRE